MRLPVSTSTEADDGERTGFLGLARGGEDLARFFEGADVEAAGTGAAEFRAVLCARERRVMESTKSTTSRPTSTRRLARSMPKVGDADVILDLLVVRRRRFPRRARCGGSR